MSLYINEGYWQKAYLIEFKQNGAVTDAFTFSIPPQSEDFDFPQRLGETKTFGGTVVDDYGNDIVNITLSGTTVNQSVKIIYKSDLGYEYLNGEEEIFYLKNLIDKYGKIEKLHDKSVYLYELKSGSKAMSAKWWRGYVKDLQIKRSKEAPLTYFYTLNFIGTSGVPKKKITNWLDDVNSFFNKTLGYVSNIMSVLKEGLSYYQDVINIISTIDSNIQKVYNEINSFSSLISGYISTTSDIINETVKLGDTIIKDSQRVILNSGLGIFISVKNLNNSVKDLVDIFANFDEKEITSDLIEGYGRTAKEIKETWTSTARDVEDKTCELSKLSKVLNDKVCSVVVPGSDVTDDKVIVAYGYSEKTVNTGDTWDSLAMKYYGDPELGPVIATYNSTYNAEMKDVTELKTGEKILIPVLSSRQSETSDNQVFLSPDNKDILGADIDISSGDFDFKNNDYIVINSTENLSQAINDRLSTVIGSKIRDEVYGIRSGVGDVTAASSFILASIESTLAEEPRIKSVDGIKFNTENGKLQIDIEYTDINDKKSSYRGNV